MRLEEFNSLSEDEVSMLWYAINKTTPPVLAGVELDPSVFCTIKSQYIRARIDQIELSIKDEYRPIYDSLRQKLNMAPIAPLSASNEASSDNINVASTPNLTET